MKNILFIITLIGLLTSCFPRVPVSLYHPVYINPLKRLGDPLPESEEHDSDNHGFSDLSFDPCEINNRELDIADIINIALTNNPITSKTWSDILASSYTVKVAASTRYPSATIKEIAAYTDLRFTHLPDGGTASGPGSTTVAGSSSTQNTPVVVSASGPVGYSKILIHSIFVSYLLMDFGGREASINSAKQALYSTELQGDRTIQQVMFDVLQHYYHYMGFKALVKAKNNDIENAQASVNLSSEQFQAGIVTKLDMLQASSGLVENQSSLAEIKASEEIAWGSLMIALGLPANTQMNLKDPPHDIPLNDIEESVCNLIQIAQKERPDLAASFANYRKTQDDIAVAWSNGQPALYAQGGWQRTLFFNNPIANQSYVASAFVLEYPIFSGFLHENETKRAIEKSRAAYADIETMQLNVTLDVVRSYYQFKAAVDRVKFSQEFLTYTQEAYDFAFASYREGIATIVDLLLAQKNIAQARAQYIQARVQWAVALANISFATGTL